MTALARRPARSVIAGIFARWCYRGNGARIAIRCRTRTMIEGILVCPGRGDMATITLYRGREVPGRSARWLLRRNTSGAVTAQTVSGGFRTVIECTIQERTIDSMTINTICRCIDVWRRCIEPAGTIRFMAA